MKNRFTSSLLVFFLFCIFSTSAYGLPAAQSPTTESNISIKTDGTSPFDGTTFDPGTGDFFGTDDGGSNGIVRNFDAVTYNVEVSINDADDTNILATVTLNDKGNWLALPLECRTLATSPGIVPDSAILDTTGDGLNDTLICNFGDQAEGKKFVIMPKAEATGSNGEILQASVSSTSDNNVPGPNQNGGPVEVVITAGFGVSLTKSVNGLSLEDEDRYSPTYFPASVFGREGKRVTWHVNLSYIAGSGFVQDDGTGTQSFTIRDTWVGTHSADPTINSDNDAGVITDGIELFGAITGNPADSCAFTNSSAIGTVTCTQAAPGEPIIIQASGIPVYQQPLASVALNMYLPYDTIFTPNGFATGEMYFVENRAELTGWGGPGVLTTSSDGSVDPGPDIGEADYPISATRPGPAAHYKSFVKRGPSKTGARVATAGELVETTLELVDHRFANHLTGVCDTIDTSVFEFAGDDGTSQLNAYFEDQGIGTRSQFSTDFVSPGVGASVGVHTQFNPQISAAHLLNSNSNADNGLLGNVFQLDALLHGGTVEYTDVDYAVTGDDHWSATCEDDLDGDGSSDWVSDSSLLSGGAASVVRVRMMWDRDYLALAAASTPDLDRSYMLFSFNLKILPTAPVATLLPNTAATFRDTAPWNGVWLAPNSVASPSVYFNVEEDPTSPLFSFDAFVDDRVYVLAVSMGVRKTTVPSPTPPLKGGDPAVFSIQPTTSGTNIDPVTMTLTDTLPAQLSYVSDDCVAAYAAVGLTCTVTVVGNSVTWDITGYNVGDPMPQITLNAVVNNGVSAGNYTNRVSISSDLAAFTDTAHCATAVDSRGVADADAVEDCEDTALGGHSSAASITILGEAGFGVSKEIEECTFPGQDFNTVLKYFSLGGNLGSGQIIDVLSHNDDCDPGTLRFNSNVPANANTHTDVAGGNGVFVAVVGALGETFEYSVDPYAAIDHRPCHPSNWAVGDILGTGNAQLDLICSQGLIDPATDIPTAAQAGTGSTTWGALPADPSTVTAFRATLPNITAGSGELEILLTMNTGPALEGDLLCNNFGANTPAVTLDVISNDVCIPVKAGSIGDTIWWDQNEDGVQDAGEPPLPGVEVKLLDGAGNPIFQDPVTGAVVPADYPGAVPYVAVTDANGQYLFENLPPGDYNVMVDTSTLPPGMSQTFDADGAGDDMSAVTIGPVVDPETGAVLDIEDNLDQDFGYNVPAASLGDVIFLDANMDGIQDPGEVPVEGVVVTLVCFGLDGVLGGTDDQVLTSVTDANGQYFFPNLLPGINYQVTITPPAGFDFSPQGVGGDSTMDSSVDPLTGSTPIINLTEGENNLSYDAGIFQPNGEASVLWNGFCDQQNFVMLNNTCTGPVVITLELFGMSGESLGAEVINLAGLQQLDFSINSLPGFSMFDMGIANLVSIPGGCVQGDMGLFAPIGAGQFFSASIMDDSFGGTESLFALADGSQSNSCYAGFNTFQPSVNPEDQGLLTYHFLQLANLSDEKQNFTVNRYDLTGELISTDLVIVNSMGRQDIDAGHSSGIQSYGIVEVVPAVMGTDYTAQLFRYGVDQTTLSGERMSAFSLSDNCSTGLSGDQYVGVSKGAGAANWLELLNISNVTQSVNVEVFSNTGGYVSGYSFELLPYETVHFDAGEGLLDGESGVAKIGSTNPVIAKSTSYIYRADGRILTSETLEGRGLLSTRGAGSFNGFRNQLNWLRLYNVSGAEVAVTISGTSQSGESLPGQSVTLSAESGKDVNLNELLSIGATDVGTVQLEVSVGGAVLADIVRVQHSGTGTLEDIETFSVN